MTELTWVRPPLQDRSAQTLQSLLDAAEALLEQRRFEELSVQAVCERAGCSVGAFYGRFPAKQDLLRALYARYHAVSLATLGALPHDLPLAEGIAAMVRFIVADYRRRPGLRRAFQAGIATDPEVRNMSAELSAATCAALARFLDGHHPDPVRAADVLHRVVFGVLDQDNLVPEGPIGRPLSDGELTAELVTLVTGYLGVSP